MEYRILGPLEVVDEGEPVPVGRLKERLVLATLLLHANEFVARERLMDELWGSSPPPTARKVVNVYVSQLRKALIRNGHDPITTEDGGYRIGVDADSLDVTRMQRLLTRARDQTSAGEVEQAAELLREALALWRGPTLAGLLFESRGRDEIERLDDLRLTALMDRIDCDLALGRHQEVLGELHVLVAEHPLQERLRGQQMLALYRAGRQADALDAYRQARRALVDELGIEPSEALQRLQQGILRHDPALETPAGTAGVPSLQLRTSPPAAPTSTSTPRRHRRPRRRLLAAVGVGVVALAGSLAFLSTRAGGHDGSRPAPQIAANSIAQLDPRSGEVLSDVPVGIEPGSMAFSGSSMWLVNRGSGTITRYNVRRGTRHTIGVASTPYDIAADAEGNVWVSDRKPTVTWILHAAAGAGTAAVPPVLKDVSIPGTAAGAEAVGAGYLWVIAGPLLRSSGNNRVSLIDVSSHELVKSIPLHGQTTAIAFAFGSAWVGSYDARDSTSWLSIVRPGSSRPTRLRLEAGDGWGPLDIAAGAGSIWVLTSAGTVVKIDPETQRVLARRSIAAQQPRWLAAGDGAVWTANLSDSLSQIDPATDRLVRTIPLGSYIKTPCGLAAAHDSLWVAIGDAYCDTTNR
jgi:DNA-binding SARP family transcriptional activator/DNA-binding beta-propeller fold protein YncE